MEVTTRRTMVTALGLGAVLGWLFISGMEMLNAAVPVPPWTLIVLLVLMGALAAIWALMLRRRVREDFAHVSSEEGVLALTTGKALLLTGLLLAGGHLVLVASFVGRWSVPLPRERVIFGGLTVVVSMAAALGGWLLERACVVGSDDDDDADRRG